MDVEESRKGFYKIALDVSSSNDSPFQPFYQLEVALAPGQHRREKAEDRISTVFADAPFQRSSCAQRK